MVKIIIRYSNGDTFAFESEESNAHAAATTFLTEFHAQRNLLAQARIDQLTSQLSGQNDRLASGVATNQPPVPKE